MHCTADRRPVHVADAASDLFRVRMFADNIYPCILRPRTRDLRYDIYWCRIGDNALKTPIIVCVHEFL